MRFYLLGLSALLPALASAQEPPKRPPAVSPLPIGLTDQEKQDQGRQKPNPIAELKTSKGTITIELFVDEAPETIATIFGLANGTLEFRDMMSGKPTKRPFYDGLTFHRIIPGFMIQGGCPMGTGGGTPGFDMRDEINAKALGLDKIKVTSKEGQHALLIRSQQDWQKAVMRPVLKKLGIDSQEEFDKRKDELRKTIENYTLYDAFKQQGYQYNDTMRSHKMLPGTLAMANHGPNTNGSQFFINLVDNAYLNGKHTVFGKVIKGMEIVSLIAGVKMTGHDRPLEAVTIESLRVVKHADRIPAAKPRTLKPQLLPAAHPSTSRPSVGEEGLGTPTSKPSGKTPKATSRPSGQTPKPTSRPSKN